MDLSTAANVGFERYGVTFRPLSLQKIAELESWLRGAVLDAGFAYLYAHAMPAAVQADYIKGLTETAAAVEPFHGVGAAMMEKPAAWVKILELASDGAFDVKAFAARIEAREPGLPASMPALLAELRVRLAVAANDEPADPQPAAPAVNPAAAVPATSGGPATSQG